MPRYTLHLDFVTVSDYAAETVMRKTGERLPDPCSEPILGPKIINKSVTPSDDWSRVLSPVGEEGLLCRDCGEFWTTASWPAHSLSDCEQAQKRKFMPREF